MRICRHLKAFEITVKVTDHGAAGLPPWMALCEDCAATVFEALKAYQDQENKPRTVTMADGSSHDIQRSGKSSGAVNWARAGRILEDLANG